MTQRVRRSTLEWMGWQQQALRQAGEADELLVLHVQVSGWWCCTVKAAKCLVSSCIRGALM